MAGLIYGIYNQMEPQQIVNYATTAAFGKLQEQGDATGQNVLTISRRAKPANDGKKIEINNAFIENEQVKI